MNCDCITPCAVCKCTALDGSKCAALDGLFGAQDAKPARTLTEMPFDETQGAGCNKSTTGDTSQAVIPEYITDFDPVMFKAHKYVVSENTQKAVDSITAEISLIRKKYPRRQREAITALICSLFGAWRAGQPLGIWLNKEHFQKAKAVRRYHLSYHTHARVSYAVSEFKRLGYISVEPGFKDVNTGEAHCTKLYSTERLTRLFPFEFQTYPNEVLILRDADKMDVNYPETNYTREKRKFIYQYNEFMSHHAVTIDGSRLCPNIFAVHSRGSFDLGGRFYTGANGHLSLTRDDRKRILINGQATAEPDFSSLHPRLLYYLHGLTPPDDCYTPVCDALAVSKAIRPAAKKLTLCMINAKDKLSAQRAFNGWFNTTSRATQWSEKKQAAVELRQAMQSEGVYTSEIIEAIYEFHTPIADSFCTDAGVSLMFIDSELMRGILTELMDKGIPALPVHDSLRVPAVHAVEVEAVMNRHLKAYSDSQLSKIQEGLRC